MPPTGGARDSIAPVLIKAEPGENTRNFRGNKIVLEFDEYITLDNPFEKLVFSPVPKINPTVEGRLKNVTIKLKDTLEENTTYTIHFGDAIKDINESNILRNFSYTFSTGPVIDSLTIHGRVFIAESGKTDSTMIAVLHRNMDDSAVAKDRPRYYTKLDRDGNFSFTHLSPGEYRLFALGDMDGGKKYDPSELIAFLDQPVSSGQPSNPVMYAFIEKQEKEEEEKPKSSGTTSKADQQKNKDDKRLKYSTNLENGRVDILGNLELNFENPLKDWDSTKLIFTDEGFSPVRPYTIRPDSSPKKLVITHQWIPEKKYNLIIQKDFASDSLGNSILRTDTIAFAAKNTTDYGSVRINITNLDTTLHPRLLFYKSDKLEMSVLLNTGRIQYPLFRPGEYEIRILYDTNANGVWDTGNYWQKLQPERVVLRKQLLNVRSNWDNEFTMDLSDLNK